MISERLSGALPVLVTITGRKVEGVPTACDGKVRNVGEKPIPAVADTPVQVSATV